MDMMNLANGEKVLIFIDKDLPKNQERHLIISSPTVNHYAEIIPERSKSSQGFCIFASWSGVMPG